MSDHLVRILLSCCVAGVIGNRGVGICTAAGLPKWLAYTLSVSVAISAAAIIQNWGAP